MQHANCEPCLIERNHRIDELVGILTADDQRYLADGFIVTENGRYLGLGTADQLVRSVTETRIEAARHANPLTFLRGNVPISQHLDRLLKSGADFVACYADLNDLKPFNLETAVGRARVGCDGVRWGALARRALRLQVCPRTPGQREEGKPLA